MDRRRAPAAVKPDCWDAADDPDEIGVFAAERYFYGDDALWCERSSSSLSLSSSAFRTGTLEHARSVVTAGTSSSEASWNSRSALLPVPIEPSDEKSRGAGAATPVAETEPCSGAESGRAERRRASSSSNSNLRRWLLAVAGCACARGDSEESVSADETEAGDDVLGAGGKKYNAEAEMIPELVFEEATAVTVRAGSGRWLLEGDQILARMEASSPIDIAGHGHRRAASSIELPVPVVLHPAATASSGERRRVKSLDEFRPLGDGQGSALGPATQNAAFTIAAGNAPRAAAGGGGSPGAEDDDATPSELGCAYPPSEASVVWSVVTADGAASGNFSSAASGYYYHYFSYGEDSTLRHAAANNGHRRRRRGITVTGSSLLMTCMNEKAVDAVGPVHRPEVEPAAMARLGVAGGSRNGHPMVEAGGYQDVMRRRGGR